jgi:hypothetical protein
VPEIKDASVQTERKERDGNVLPHHPAGEVEEEEEEEETQVSSCHTQTPPPPPPGARGAGGVADKRLRRTSNGIASDMYCLPKVVAILLYEKKAAYPIPTL